MNFFNKYVKPLKNFLFLWFGQSLSQIGSTMTGFAVTIWAFEKTGSALVLSISALLIMVPDMIFGILAGPLVDRANKKTIMILADIGTGICTLALFLLLRNEALEIWHIYIINVVKSTMNSFQSLASNVAVSAVVPKEYYVKTSGLQSFSGGVMQVLAPVFAAILLGIVGITGVIIFDFVSLAFACITLAAFVKIPMMHGRAGNEVSDRSVIRAKEKITCNIKQYFTNLDQGYKVVKGSTLLWNLLLFMIPVNLIAGVTYYSLISPMILARTSNDSRALLFVNAAIGTGSMAGALLVFLIPSGKRKIKTMLVCLALSFLLGDVLFAIGTNLYVWVMAGFFTSVFLPLFRANEGYYWRTIIPLELQGRAFSLKYALQSGVAPIGMILGGLLADYVFEPLMARKGSGAGMALMFFITGVLGTIYCLIGIFGRSMQKTEAETVSIS